MFSSTRLCVSCFSFHCHRAYITVVLAEKTLGRCLESVALKFICTYVCVCLLEVVYVRLNILCNFSEEKCVLDSFETRCFLVDCIKAPETKYINMRVFGDVTRLQSIKMTKDTCTNDCHRLQ